MKINNYKFFNVVDPLLIGLKKEIESNPLLLPFFSSNAASAELKNFISNYKSLYNDHWKIADNSHFISGLLDEINSLLTFADQNSNKEEFYTRHLGESKDKFYSRTNIKDYKMYSEIFRIRKISDKAIELIKTVNELSYL